MFNYRSLSFFASRRKSKQFKTSFRSPTIIHTVCPVCGAECFLYPGNLELMELKRIWISDYSDKIVHVKHECEVK